MSGGRIAEQQHASRAKSELLLWVRSNLHTEESLDRGPRPDLDAPGHESNFTYVPTGEVAGRPPVRSSTVIMS